MHHVHSSCLQCMHLQSTLLPKPNPTNPATLTPATKPQPQPQPKTQPQPQPSGVDVAHSPDEVAQKPFFGIYGPYAAAKDPWARPANRAYLREFYTKASAWLADPGRMTYRVAKVYVWSLASWDVLGVYPESTTAEGSYYDATIGQGIRKHNAAMRGVVSGGGGGGGGGGSGSRDLPSAAGRR